MPTTPGPQFGPAGMRRGTDSVAIVSGGLDSVTMLYKLMNQGHWPHVLSFNYGQRHAKELEFATYHARELGLPHDIIDLTGITKLISNSALTSSANCICGPWHPGSDGPQRECPVHGDEEHVVGVPDGHYAEENMKITVVPNRNMIMLSIAAGVAVNESAGFVALGVHAGDHFIYPDCRPRFITAANAAVVIGNAGFGGLPEQPEGTYVTPDNFIRAPFIYSTKMQIAYDALKLGVPLHQTWSCYKGGEYHCGRCGTCVERLEAIDAAIQHWKMCDPASMPYIVDRTVYTDTEFWKTTTK